MQFSHPDERLGVEGRGGGGGMGRISIFEVYDRVEQSVISVSKGTYLDRCIFWL